MCTTHHLFTGNTRCCAILLPPWDASVERHTKKKLPAHQGDLGVRDVGVGEVIHVALGLCVPHQDDALGQHPVIPRCGAPDDISTQRCVSTQVHLFWHCSEVWTQGTRFLSSGRVAYACEHVHMST